MEQKQFTWYVNLAGDVQVYEGNINEDLFWEYEDAKDVEKHIAFDGRFWDKDFFEKFTPCKYFIPSEYKEAFFMCIGEPVASPSFSGVTNVNVSDFLD